MGHEPSGRSAADWSKRQLGDVARIEIGGTPSRDIPRFWSSDGTGFPWASITDLMRDPVVDTAEKITLAGVVASSTKLVPKGTPLVSFKLTVGRVATTGVDLYTNEAIAAVYPDPAQVDLHWLVHALSGITTSGVTDQAIKGATLNSKKLQQLSVNLPPLPEQRRIAQVLDPAEATIRRIEEVITKLEQIQKGVLHDLLTRGLDEEGRLRPTHNEAPELYKETAIGWVPREWDVVRVDEAGSVQLGRQRAPRYQTGRYKQPYLRVANVFDGFIDYSDVLSMDFTPSERAVYALQPGDILLCEGQDWDKVGRPAIYEGPRGAYCFQNTLVRFKAFSGIESGYTLELFRHYLHTGVFAHIALQTTSVAHLGAARFAALPFLRPSPEEQRRIDATRRKLVDRIAAERKQLEKLRSMKRGLMQDLLTGRLRVPVDVGAGVAMA